MTLIQALLQPGKSLATVLQLPAQHKCQSLFQFVQPLCALTQLDTRMNLIQTPLQPVEALPALLCGPL